MRITRWAFVALCLSTVLAGCGGGVKAADLFIVYRSGTVPGARLTVLVNEEGGLTCNGHKAPPISDPELIDARAIQEEIKEYAEKHLSLAARSGSVLHYYLRDENGTVSFSDNSTGQPAVLRQLSLFVLKVAQGPCGQPI
jgi:hypothetical protein